MAERRDPESSARAFPVGALGRSLLLAVLFGIAASARAADVGFSQLGLERWTPASGLAGSWVRAIAESDDGFVWIATSGGLSRFDGKRFVSFTAANEPALPANGVATLAPRAAGGLWLGLDVGGVRIVEAGRVIVPASLAPLDKLRPRALLESPPGTLWIAAEDGLWRFRAGKRELLVPSEESRGHEVLQLRSDARGGVWVRTRDDGLWRIERETAEHIPDAPDCVGIDLVLSADDRPITACVNGIWERTAAGNWQSIDATAFPNRLFEDRAGTLWVAGRDSFKRRLGDGWEVLTPSRRDLGDFRVRAFHEDASGGLWIGTYSGGIARLRRGAVSPVGAPEGLDFDGITGVAASRDGSLWIGTWNRGAIRWSESGGILERWSREQGLPSSFVYTAAEDPVRPRHFWLGTWSGLVEVNQGRVRVVERPEERTSQDVRLLYVDPAATSVLWVGGARGGLDEVQGASVRRHDRRNGLAIERVRQIRRLSSGRLVAAGEEGLFWLDSGTWRRWGPPGPPLPSVRTFVEASDGTLWLSSPRDGVMRWAGSDLARFGERDGLPTAALHSLELDRAGSLWLSSDEGVERIRLGDFDRWRRGELDSVPVERLSGLDGMRDRECNGWGFPSSAPLADGRLVYPTSHGLEIVDPARVVTAPLRPEQLYLDRAWTGERELAARGPWELGTLERHLRVTFGAREYLRPEAVQLRYRLEGLDRSWVFAGNAREAHYSFVPPGSYRLHLEGRLPGQEWVESPDHATVRVAPRFWESPLVRSLAVAALFGAALGFYAWRSRVRRAYSSMLRRERAFLRAVVDISPNPIFAKDRHLVYTLANRAAAALYGLLPREVVGRPDRDLAARMPGMSALVAIDEEVLASQVEQIRPELRLDGREGDARWFRIVERPMLDGAGRVDQIVGTAVDVTDFKLAEEQLRGRERELEASREELRRLARRLLTVQEEERRRLGRELHDDLTQRLAGLAMLIGGLARSARREQEDELAARLEEAGRGLDRLTSDSQAMARDLHPSLLENLGLEKALSSECEDFAARTGMEVDYRSQGDLGDVAPEVGIVLFRIAQEALRNAQLHSRQDRVRVELVAQPPWLELKVIDAGCGFEPKKRPPGRGLGLSSMKERARLIGAELAVDSAPGAGTTIRVRVACEAAVPAELSPVF